MSFYYVITHILEYMYILCCLTFQVHVSFLFVGHTHEDIDSAFHMLADRLRRSDAETVPDLLHLLDNAEEVKGGLYDIKKWLTPCLNQPKKHTQPHHFRFLQTPRGAVESSFKGRHNSTWKKLDCGFLRNIPTGIPPVVLPDFSKNINLQSMGKELESTWSHHFGCAQSKPWWCSYLGYLTQLESSTRAKNIYAKGQNRWMLPLLPKQPPLHRATIDPALRAEVEAIAENEASEILVSVHKTSCTFTTRGPGALTLCLTLCHMKPA